MIHILSKKKEEVSKGVEVKWVCLAVMYVGLFFSFPTKTDMQAYL